jgi:hypothetical protein
MNLRYPTARCKDCEYFDRGAMGLRGHSDCLNPLSDRFETTDQSEACLAFYPDTMVDDE